MEPRLPESTALAPRRYWPALALAALVGGFFLWSEHRAHLLGALPYLLILACPLAHWSLHGRGHGSHASGGDGTGGSEP